MEDTESIQSSPDTKPKTSDSGEAPSPPLQALESVTTREVTPADLAEQMVAKYIVAVIMAPMSDEFQTDKVSGEILAKLTSGAFKARWIVSQDGRRAGVIVFAVQDTSLYVVGVAFPPDAPASGWDALLAHGLQEARLMGCKNVTFDCYGNSEFRLGIVGAAMRAGAHGRFNIGV